MMRVVLADDEPLALLRLRTLLAERHDVTIVGETGEGAAAEIMISELKPDVAILDVRMPNQSGLQLARALENTDVDVIFVTAFDHYATQAFDVDAVDYLMKPISGARLDTALTKAARRKWRRLDQTAGGHPPAGRGDVIWAPGRDGLVSIPVETVEWIEAARDYVVLHTRDKAHLLRSTMDKILEHFPDDAMLRVSRSAIVRRTSVVHTVSDGSSGTVAILRDGTPIKVGPSYAATVRRIFAA